MKLLIVSLLILCSCSMVYPRYTVKMYYNDNQTITKVLAINTKADVTLYPDGKVESIVTTVDQEKATLWGNIISAISNMFTAVIGVVL